MRYIDLDKTKEIDRKKVVLFTLALAWIFLVVVAAFAFIRPGGQAAAEEVLVTPSHGPGLPANSTPTVTAAVTPIKTLDLNNPVRCTDGGQCDNSSIIRPNETPVFSEYASGVRDLGQLFTIHRENVTGYKDMTVKITAYGYKITNQVKIYSDYWGDYIDQHADPDMKYVFVYLVEYVDGDTSKNDSRPWYYGEDQFKLQVGPYLYDEDDNFNPVLRVKEMEAVRGYNRIQGLNAFGYKIIQKVKTGNKTAELDPWIKLGISNAKDGYLVYQVPEDAKPEDMILMGGFASLGKAGWRLA